VSGYLPLLTADWSVNCGLAFGRLVGRPTLSPALSLAFLADCLAFGVSPSAVRALWSALLNDLGATGLPDSCGWSSAMVT
jgi:hypothetical protein